MGKHGGVSRHLRYMLSAFSYVDDFLATGVTLSPGDLLKEVGKYLKINIQPESQEERFIGNLLRAPQDGVIVQTQAHYTDSIPSNLDHQEFDTLK